MSDLVMGQNAGSPNTPSAGKVALGYNNVTGRWEGRLPNGDIVTFSNIFGNQVAVAQREEEITNTTTTPNQYQTLNFTCTVGLVYRIGFSTLWRYSVTNRDPILQLLLNGNQILGPNDIRHEPKDAGADQRHPAAQTAYFLATQVSNALVFQFEAQQAGDTVNIHRGLLEVWNTGLTSIPTGE